VHVVSILTYFQYKKCLKLAMTVQAHQAVQLLIGNDV